MGSVCHYQQQSSETYFNQEIRGCNHISQELKPKSINNSIKHDLKAKYLQMDSYINDRPQMREVAVQTQISFYNITQSVTLSKNRQISQKKKKKQKSKDKLIFDNFESNKPRSISQLSQTQKKLFIYQSCKNQGGNKLQRSQPYIVLINSQKESITNSFPSKQLKQ